MGHFGEDWGFRSHCGDFSGHSGADLGLFEVIVGSIWGHFGVDLGLFAVILGWIWGFLGSF